MAWTALTTCLRKRVNPDGAVQAPLVPVAATIANAVYDATGVRIRELPITAEKVLHGLHEAGL